MDRFIGLDVHASSSTFAVVGPSGKRLCSQVVETNGQALVSYLKMIPGKLQLCLEECTQSSWLAEILEPHVERLVVMGLGQTPSRGSKDDRRDAFWLADRMRLNDIEAPVYKHQGAFAALRQLVKVHAQIVRDVVRVQNRIRALFRSRGMVVAGKSLYSTLHRARYIEQLPPKMVPVVEHLYAQYDALLPVKRSAEKDLLAESHRHPISKVLETCPGLGAIRVARLVATVVSPHRFRKRQQFWSYCGLGIVMRSSSDWVRTQDGEWVKAPIQRTRGLNRNFNRSLKHVFKGAATTVIGRAGKNDPLYQHYRDLLDGGTKPNLAKLTISRQIASIVLSVWRSQEVYDPKKLNRKT